MAIKYNKQLGTSELEVYTTVVDITVNKNTISFGYKETAGDVLIGEDRLSISYNNTDSILLYSACYDALTEMYPTATAC
jgi:hypothetical protein